MANLAENLRTEILAATPLIGTRCHKNHVPQSQGKIYPRVWYQRTSKTDDPDLDGTVGGLIEELYDIEVMSEEADEAETVADTIRTALHAKQGTFGAGTIKACFVSDVDDNYEPRGIGSDDGINIVALQVRILHGS